MKRLMLMLYFIPILIYGCILNPDNKANDDENESNNNIYYVSEYYPLKVGIIISYEMYYKQSSEEYYGEVVESVIGTDVIGGKQYFKVQTSLTWEGEETRYKYAYLRYDGNSVVKGGDSDYFTKLENGSWPGEINYFPDDELLLISLQKNLGQEYVYTDIDLSGNTNIQTETMHLENVVINNVSIPNCLKCDISSQTTRINGSLVGTHDWISWYAKDIGLIKYYSMQTDEDAVITTRTYTLINYRMP